MIISGLRWLPMGSQVLVVPYFVKVPIQTMRHHLVVSIRHLDSLELALLVFVYQRIGLCDIPLYHSFGFIVPDYFTHFFNWL
jgi:hypothetical protein